MTHGGIIIQFGIQDCELREVSGVSEVREVREARELCELIALIAVEKVEADDVQTETDMSSKVGRLDILTYTIY